MYEQVEIFERFFVSQNRQLALLVDMLPYEVLIYAEQKMPHLLHNYLC